ncbi:DNA repair protein RecO [Thermorudis peleae]|uniref:DNA repair protein RecO n=1 Tax=Thermorudis peleae TaxID=1382356 RepID=UPI00068ADCB3|nr:DNA repair protein RecO [Thermorudis peleae]
MNESGVSPALHERRNRLYRVEAIVLRRYDLGEADRILVLYTLQRGKLRVKARGVRRPRSRLAGHLELFARTQLVLAQGHELDVVAQAMLLDPHRGLRESELRVAYAGYCAELLDALTSEADPQSAIFHLLAETLAALAHSSDPFFIVRHYELCLLTLLGFRPELYRCLACDRELQPLTHAFVPSLGGLVCADCAAQYPGALAASVPVVKALRLLLDPHQWTTLLERRTSERLRHDVEAIAHAYVTSILGRPIASHAVLEQLQRPAFSLPAEPPA